MSNRKIILQEYLKLQRVKNAGFDMSDVVNGIVKNFESQIDKDNIPGTIISFLFNGLLWRNFKLLAILKELFSFMGFDINGALRNFFGELFNHLKQGQKPSEETVNDMAEKHLSELPSITPNIFTDFFVKNMNKIPDAIQSGLLDQDTANRIIKGGKVNPQLIKIAAGGFKGLMLKLFAGLALVAMPVILAGGAKGLLGVSEPKKDNKSSEDAKKVKYITISPSNKINSSITEYHHNDEMHNWVERFPDNETANELIDWALNLYPDMIKFKSEIPKSPTFKKIVNMIQRNNRDSNGVIVMPKPYSSKEDVVNSFMQEVIDSITTKLRQKYPDAPK
jgi:hypothetical protein